MPNYIAGGLAEYALPPYNFTGFGSTTFILPANDGILQGLCDQFLNAPLNRSTADKFVPGADNRMILVCSTFPKVAAKPTQPFGYSIYSETALMFSVYDKKNHEWGWYVPVLFLDGPRFDTAEWQAELPIAVGREVYGLAKTRAEIDIDPSSHAVTVKPLDPATPSNPVTVKQVITVTPGNCALLSDELALAASETELLGLEIELQRDVRAGGSGRRFKRQAARLTKRLKLLRTERDMELKKRRAELEEIARLEKHPDERKVLSPQELIKMLWGGDPYGNVDEDPPDDPEALLRNLGFFRKAPHPSPVARRVARKVRGTRRMMLTAGPSVTSEFDFEVEFNLLGLRQFRDPVNTQLATVQQIVRTHMGFDRLPWSPLLTFCVKIEDPLAGRLGVAKQQTLSSASVYMYKLANASFGAPAKIVT